MPEMNSFGKSTIKSGIISLLIACSVFFGSPCLAAETARYVGAKKCQACHSEQYAIWSKSPHAKTYPILGSEEAKPVACKLNVTGDPRESPECLKCHVTGYGQAGGSFAKSYDRTEGITCETCHGPGSLYLKAMAADEDTYKADPKATVAQWAKLGLAKPDAALCKSCHTQEENFNFAEKFKKIAHPR